MDLGAKLKRNADEFPDKTAIIFKDRFCSYAEMNERAARLGNGMRQVDFVGELPKTDTGKILKKILRAPYWKDRDVKI